MQRVSDRVSYVVLLTAGAACILAFLLIRLPRADNSVISIDGPGYFSYLRSVVFDRDLDFRNEYSHFGWSRTEVASTGLVDNPWSVGPALLWAPFYLAAHVLSLAAYALGVHVNVHGYGYVYESAVCIATIVYVTAGCFLTYRICRRYFSPLSSLIGVLGVYLASSLIHYTVPAPAMSHGLSFFAVSLFLFLWHPPRSRSQREWILLGLAAGLMTLVRWQNVLYLSMLAIEGIQAIRTAGPGRRAAILQEYVKGAAIVALVGVVAFLPQMLAWNTLYGSPLAIPQGDTFFDWSHPQLFEYLFSTRHGLYTWHPVMLVATLGLVPFWRRDRKLAVALVVALLLQWYLNSAVAAWWAGDAFGARRFIAATSLLALAMAALAESLTERFRRGALLVVGAVTALVGWNLLFDLQYSWGFISYGEALTWDELVVGKFRMIVELIGRVVPLP